ncbi:MAG: SWIM zinc finger family protein [Candidatus Tectomicrobia bacterium]|nr:SWIM zinc finger family protein [Candidatus Tectomicrobia bacterium]
MLQRAAGARSFERGEGYFAGGRVGSLAEHGGTVTAKVRGTLPYRVKFWIEDGKVRYSCTCPVGQDGAFCKHCVAVGLAWLDQARPDHAGEKKLAKPVVTMKDVRAYLAGQDKNALVDLLMEQGMDDDRLRQRLLMKAAKERAKGLDLATYRLAIDEAVDGGGFVDYRGAYDYASRIEEVIDAVEDILKGGYASEVIDLTEHALEDVEAAIESVDDSDGHMGGILERLQELHLKACRKAMPDPEELARRLFAWELRAEWDTFYGAADTYADVLGEKGLAVYRTLAEAEWAKVRPLGPGRDDPAKYGTRFRITHIMETLARRTGDVEAVVAVKTRDLSTAYDYLQIAETYQQAGKHDLALDWAERGVTAFPTRTDPRLREFLAAEYHRRGRHDDAMALAWAEFAESPTLDRYQNLKRHADKIGQWTTWRAKALDLLRQSIAAAKRQASGDRWAWERRSDHTELVRVFLWEKDIKAAWREATEGGCADDQWMELAKKREKSHPEDALPLYQRRIEPTLSRKNNEAYREAVGLLKKVQELMARLGRESEFAQYLASVRAAHKPKRNFMKLLERTQW